MPVHDDLGNRMKAYYENIPKTKLMRRTPVIIRVDGKAFHTFTTGFKRPFDDILIGAMQKTTKYLCEKIQGCVLGYTQSDEISLVLIDYQKLGTSAWFDYEVQKICSIAASMTTLAFNKYFKENVYEYIQNNRLSSDTSYKDWVESTGKYISTLIKARNVGAMFDARVFNIPKEEVTNCLYWRQLDASRNSIQMVGQSYFSHKELMNKSCSDIQDMLMEKYNVNWNNFPTYKKRGSCCIKEEYFVDENGCESKDALFGSLRSRWIIDKEIPIFKGDGRNYVDRLIFVGE